MPLVVPHAFGRREVVSRAVGVRGGNDRRRGALAAGGGTGRRRGGGNTEDTHCDDVQRDRGAGGDRSVNPHDSSVGQIAETDFSSYADSRRFGITGEQLPVNDRPTRSGGLHRGGNAEQSPNWIFFGRK